MWGVLGLGTFGIEVKGVPDDRRIVTTTRSHSNKVVTDCVAAMEPHEVIRVGGAGNKVSPDQFFYKAVVSHANTPTPILTYHQAYCLAGSCNVMI